MSANIPQSFFGELKATVRLGFPIAMTMVGNMAMGIVDTFVAGQASPVELAGVAAGNSVFWTAVMICFGFLMGLDTTISQAAGGRALRRCDQGLAQGLLMATVLAALVMPIIFLITYYYEYSGAQPRVVAATKPYLDALFWSFPLLLWFNVFQRYWQALDIAVPVTVITILANILNYFGDVALVLGRWGMPPLGAAGIGYSTTICRIFTLVAIVGCSIYLWKKRNRKSEGEPFILKGCFGWGPDALRKVWAIGWPAGSQVALEVSAFAATTTVVAGLGALDLAAHHIVLTIASFTFMFPLGLSTATGVRVGFLAGAGEPGLAVRAGWLGIGVAAALMGVFGLLLYVFPDFLMGLFTNEDAVIKLGGTVIFLAALFQVFDGVQVVGAGALRGLGYTKQSLYANFVGHYVLGLPLGLTLCFLYEQGLFGLWVGLTSGLMATAIFNSWFWRRLTSNFLLRKAIA